MSDALPTVDELMELADDMARAVENRQAAYEWGYPIGDTSVNEAKAELRAALSRVLEATEAARKEWDALLAPVGLDEREWAGDPVIAWRAYHAERTAKEAAQQERDAFAERLTQVESERDTAESVTETERQAKEAAIAESKAYRDLAVHNENTVRSVVSSAQQIRALLDSAEERLKWSKDHWPTPVVSVPEPRVAHSMSEYRRLTEQGVEVLPPVVPKEGE